MFTTDSRTEKFLDSIGVRWEYSNKLTFSALRATWREDNLGRSAARVDGAVKEYGTLMDRGSAAPAPLLWRDPASGTHTVLDGIQRLLAEEARNPQFFSAYVVNTDSEAMVKKIRVFANYRLQGGYQESSEWTMERAIVLLVNQSSMSLEEVAEMGGWGLAAVRDKKQILDFGQDIYSIGGPEKLPDSIVKIIATHAQRADFTAAPDAIAGFCNDLKRARLSAADADFYIEDFFSVARSKRDLFRQFTDKLDEFRSNEDIADRLIDPARRRYQPMTPEGRLHKSLAASLTTCIRIQREGHKIPEMDEYFRIANKITSTLQQINNSSRRLKATNGKSH